MAYLDMSFGHRCTLCGASYGVRVTSGGPSRCTLCGGELASAPGTPRVFTTANTACKTCGPISSLHVSAGGPPRCPKCDKPL